MTCAPSAADSQSASSRTNHRQLRANVDAMNTTEFANWMEHDLVAAIRFRLFELEGLFRSTPGAVLTEDDFKFHLMQSILDISLLREPAETSLAGLSATYVHSELSWAGPPQANGLRALCWRPDITVLDPSELDLMGFEESEFRLDSKQAHFRGSAMALELKLHKTASPIPAGGLERIVRDLEKCCRILDLDDSLAGAGRAFVMFALLRRYECTESRDAIAQIYERFERPRLTCIQICSGM